MQVQLDKILESAISYGSKILFALVILVVGKWASRIISRLVEKSLNRTKLNKTLSTFTKNIVYYGLLIFVVVAALNTLGVETTSFVALLGAAGLAVGLALQGSLANFAAGVMIVIFQPFEVGNHREAGEQAG